jgi:arylsulfatase A-like enzyme
MYISRHRMTPFRNLFPGAALFAAAAFICLASIAGAAPAKPNVIVLLADQWRADAFGYAGDPNVKTPQFDRLQRESAHFVNAVSGLPVCSPMRASFLTGQRPLTHGIFLNDVQLNTNAVTIAKVLRGAGYNTGAIGKWHVDGRGRSNFIPRERRQGFDYWKVLECTHAYNNSFYYGDGPEKLKWQEYDAAAQTKDAQQFVREQAKSDKPFFLYLAWGPPHNPYETAPPKYQAMYKESQIKLRPNVPESFQDASRKMLAGYYAHCTALDDCLADLRRTLEETGQAENTILLFSADHGDMIGSQGMYRKQKPYDESARVPMLIHWPKGLGKQNKQLDAPMNTEDIMPTLLGLCGVSIPKSVEGLDYSGYARGGKNPGDGAALLLCASPFGEWDRRSGGKEYRALRTPRHTYVRDLKGPWLLFDNVTDPYQTNNLVGVVAQAKLQADLDAHLQRKLKAQGDEFLPGDAYVKKWGYQVNERGTVPYTN